MCNQRIVRIFQARNLNKYLRIKITAKINICAFQRAHLDISFYILTQVNKYIEKLFVSCLLY